MALFYGVALTTEYRGVPFAVEYEHVSNPTATATFVAERFFMRPSKKPCLIFFPGQPGATFQTFDRERCAREVIAPVRKLLWSDDSNPLFLLLFIIPCTNDATRDGSREEARLPRHNLENLRTPTSEELQKSLAREYANGSFEYINLPSWEGTMYPPEYAVHYARSQHADGIIFCPEGSPFPSIEEVFTAVRALEEGKMVTLAP